MAAGRAAAIALGLILLASGVLKASDHEWPDSGRAFGVPVVLLRLVIPAELVIGSLLVADLASPYAAWAAVALLVGFTVVVADRLRRSQLADAGGEAPVCACFGGLSRAPISWRTIVRNLVFVAVGLVAVTA